MSQRLVDIIISQATDKMASDKKATMAPDQSGETTSPLRQGRQKRRRRSRALVAPTKTAPRGSIPVLEDSDIRIEVPARSFDSWKRQQIHSHAMLLAKRESGAWKGSTRSWQWEMLASTERGPVDQPQKRQWRPCAERKIPFTALDTPASDAVLTLETKGSYLLSLGSYSDYPLDEELHKEEGERPSLALRFYGIPSPSVLQRRAAHHQASSKVVSALLLSIPLGYDSEHTLPGSAFLGEFDISLPATMPIKLCISSDWKIGIALLCPWRYQERSQGGTVVIFPLVQTVGADATLVRTYRYENYLDARGFDSFSKANRLWKVDRIPCKDEQPPDNPHRLTRRVLELPGYLHFLDEKNGFLMTWMSDTAWDKREAKQQMDISLSPSGIQPKSNRVVTSVSPNMWKQNVSDRESGAKVPDIDACSSQRPEEFEHDKNRQISVDFTARLDIYRLLEDILLRRPTLVPGYDQNNISISTFPCFAFDLVAVTDGGRTVELVVAFEVGKDKGSIGVVLGVDIFTQTYKELQWGKGADVQYDPVSDSVTKLSTWCKNLALQRRMRQQRVGPYSCFPNHPSDWSWLCHGASSELEQRDGWDTEIWQPLTLKLAASRRGEQLGRCSLAGLSQSLVYPDCELADNQAVITRLPVFSMRCSSGPTELVYG